MGSRYNNAHERPPATRGIDAIQFTTLPWSVYLEHNFKPAVLPNITVAMALKEQSMNEKSSMSFAQFRLQKRPARFLAKCILVFVSAFLATTRLASAADPLGATLRKDGTTTFR